MKALQPSVILTKDEFIRLLESCRHLRDKTIIAVLADGGMRVGALASCRVKNVEFNQYGAMIYFSKRKLTRLHRQREYPLLGVRTFESMACVNLFHEDFEALLWITLNKNKEAVSYRTIRKIIKSAAEKIGIKKNVPPHLLYDIRLSRPGF